MKENRRVRVTKMVIRESLIELMQEHPISKISVKMICEAADINRSTFYAHYPDQYDLLDKIQQETANGIREQILGTRFFEQKEDSLSVVTRVLEYAKANALLFKVLLSEDGGADFLSEIMLLAQKKVLEELRDDSNREPWILKYVELFAVSGVLSVIRRWLDDGCAEEPDVLAALVMDLVMRGMTSQY